MNNHEPLVTYYANVKLFSRRIRKRPINRVGGLTRNVFMDEDNEIFSDTISNLKLTIKHLLAYKNTIILLNSF